MTEDRIGIRLDGVRPHEAAEPRADARGKDHRHAARKLAFRQFDLTGIESRPTVNAELRRPLFLGWLWNAPAPAGIKPELLDRQSAPLLEEFQRRRQRRHCITVR